MTQPDKYQWVLSQENDFETKTVQIGDNWDWSFRNHVQTIFHLKNGIFYTGENDYTRAFKQIMQPILDLCYWTEDIDVKDVTFYIDGDDDKVLSFLMKKYHDNVYIRENNLETLFDDITESDIDYGGVIVEKGLRIPRVIKLNAITFCDQTDILSGAIAVKHFFTPDKLKTMKKYGWGDARNNADITIDDLCLLAEAHKEAAARSGRDNDTTGKIIEVYVVRGNMPQHYEKNDNNFENNYNQLQIIAFYKNKDGDKTGVTLYARKEEEGNLKFFTSKEVYQRALGSCVGERLVGPQIWTNFCNIHKMNFLEAASKVVLYTDDPSYTEKNQIQDMQNLEVTKVGEGNSINQVPTVAPTNIQLFDNTMASLYENAQFLGAAFDPIMGKEATSGTTFRGQERTVAQGKGSHDKRRGQRAKFIEEIYRDFIIPEIKKEILRGKKFLADLSTDELRWVIDQLSNRYANKKLKESMLKGKVITLEEQANLTSLFKESAMKKGNKWMIEILKDEFEDAEIKIGINVANKQKDIANVSDKLLSIFQFIFANPSAFMQAMQNPALAKSFENILEYGGMSIANFSSLLGSSSKPIQTAQNVSPEAPQLTLSNKPA